MERSERTRLIRDFILDNVADSGRDIVRVTAEQFGITRQSANAHVTTLVRQGLLTASGKTKGRTYELRRFVDFTTKLDLEGLEEDAEWRNKMAPLMTDVPESVLDICSYGFLEMVNNVGDHSECGNAFIKLERDARTITMTVVDDGVGVFQKLQNHFALSDPRHALLELSKGKLTSDPDKHTGEGIFFTSRMFDEFKIISGPLYFSRHNKADDEWLLEVHEQPPLPGSVIVMSISPNATQTAKEILDRYQDDNLGFSRTHVPIQLATYEGEKLLSRSQARRILVRFERFKEVMLDFRNVDEIGPAFADEIFRVFQREHPDVDIRVVFANPEVELAIRRINGLPILPGQLSLLSQSALSS